MKNKAAAFILITILSSVLLAGCANLDSLLGTGIKDLEKMRETGRKAAFPLSFDAAFDKVTKILQSNDLKIYQSNRKRKYIVAIGFPKQINTTRVGIFFESPSENQTKITLSSLSDTALAKAETIIFGGLEKDIGIVK